MTKNYYFRRILTVCLVCIISALFSQTAKAQCPVITPPDLCGASWEQSMVRVYFVCAGQDIQVFYCWRVCANGNLQVYFTGLGPGGDCIDLSDKNNIDKIYKWIVIGGLAVSGQGGQVVPCPNVNSTYHVILYNADCYHYLANDPTYSMVACDETVGCMYTFTLCIDPIEFIKLTLDSSVGIAQLCDIYDPSIVNGPNHYNCFSLCYPN